MILQLPIRRTSLPPSPYLSSFTLANWNPLQQKPRHVLHRFQYFVLLHSITSHHKHLIHQIIYKTKTIKFVVKLIYRSWYLMGQTRCPSKSWVFKNGFSFNTKYAEFSAKWQVVFHFHNPSYGYNQRCDLYQETVLLLHSSFTSLFYSYLFTKSFLQSPLTFPSYLIQQFFTSFFFCTTIPSIYTKNIFPTSNILPIQVASSYQKVREYCEDWHCLISRFFLKYGQW